jgi:hypothetical protein
VQPPFPPTVLRTNFGKILLALRDAVVAGTGLDVSHVLVTCRGDVPHYSGDQDVLLWSGGERSDWEQINSAGPLDDRRVRRLRIVMRTRVVLDPADQDLIRLTEDNLGHIALEDRTLDSVQLFFAQDDDGNSLSATAVVVGDLTDATPDPKQPEWVQSTFDVSVPYARDEPLTFARTFGQTDPAQ